MKTVRFTKDHKFSNDGGISALSVSTGDELDVNDKLAERFVARNVAELVDPETKAPADADEARARENMEAAKDADGAKASDAATTGEGDGDTADDPTDSDDGSDLDDDDAETDEGWPSEGKGKDEADENKAVKPGENK